jgi:diguanylate cyclase
VHQKPRYPRLFLLPFRCSSLVALPAFLIALVCFFIFPLQATLDTNHILFKALPVVAASIVYAFILPLPIRTLVWGWAFLLYSLWLELLKELTQVPPWWDAGLVGSFEIVGFTLIAYGLVPFPRTFATWRAQPPPFLQKRTALEPFTQSPSRTLLQERLEQAMGETLPNRHQLALFFLDLDHFKEVNDSLGHDIGDAELIRVEQLLGNFLKPADTALRIGGDEFALIRNPISNLDEAFFLVQQLLNTLSEPHRVHGQEIRITASIGIALFPKDARTAKQLLNNADAAMHHAKHTGRNNYQLYTPKINARTHSRATLAKDLRAAFEAGDLELQFQPQLEIASGKIRSFEALLRWRHPRHGLLSRRAFIRLAEETGLIIPIGAWVLETACRTCLSWQQLHSAPLRMAVNLSPRQFRQPKLADNIATILERTGLSPTDLEVEVTEGFLLENMNVAATILQSLSKLGVHISIDDFGTGYSSLTYLKRLPFDSIKIDRSFVHNISHNSENQAITKAIIALGHSLDLKVVAEGVETLEQFLYLQELSCDMAQGYFISKPLEGLKAKQWWEEKGTQGFSPPPFTA